MTMDLPNVEVPIKILRVNTRKFLSDSLNSTKVIRSNEGLCRDWRGLAHLCGVHLTNCGKNNNPMEEVLVKWQENEGATIACLLEFLEKLDRFDVISDGEDLINEDVQFYMRVGERVSVHQSPSALSNDQHILTIDDIYRRERGLDPQIYDAVVLYDDKEWDVVQILVDQLEQYNFKLCLKDRDIVPGVNFEHETFMTLIKERCNRVIILLSPNFLQCPFNNFLQLYAQAVSIEERQRKVIPCLYKFPSRKDVPKEFKFYTMLSYDDLNKWPDNFWRRLRLSISSDSSTISDMSPSSIKIRELSTSEYSQEVTREMKSVQCYNKNISSPLNTVNLTSTLCSKNSLNSLDYDKSCDSLKDCIEDNYVNDHEKKRAFSRIRKLFRTLVSSKNNTKESKKRLKNKCAVMAEC